MGLRPGGIGRRAQGWSQNKGWMLALDPAGQEPMGGGLPICLTEGEIPALPLRHTRSEKAETKDYSAQKAAGPEKDSSWAGQAGLLPEGPEEEGEVGLRVNGSPHQPEHCAGLWRHRKRLEALQGGSFTHKPGEPCFALHSEPLPPSLCPAQCQPHKFLSREFLPLPPSLAGILHL